MSAVFDFPLASETLTPDEVAQITGAQRKHDQIEWLTCNGWTYHRNRAGEPIVGRLYARLKMAGINPALMLPQQTPSLPDFSKVR